jgi:hypothetical protein
MAYRGSGMLAAMLLLATVWTTGVVAADAHAAIARIHPGECSRSLCADNTAVYEAAPGERNQLRITQSPEGFTFRDEGAAVGAGPGCAVQPGGAFCPTRGNHLYLRVQLGDRDDYLDASNVESVSAAGDAGADVLLGGTTGDHFGNRLAGGGGNDRLRGGPRDDALAGDGTFRPLDSDEYRAPPDAARGQDVLDGGGGPDSASYEGRRSAVAIDLARGIGGAAGENDQLISIEGANGGRGNDSLRGDAQNNTLDGLPGNDVINGGDGSDQLLAGQGNDLVRGGTGNDVLEANGRYGSYGGGTPGRDRLLCGRGSDDVKSPEFATYVSPECERASGIPGVAFGDFQIRLPLRSLRSPSVAIEQIFCLEVACRTGMSFRLVRRIGKGAAGTLIAHKSVRLRANGKRRCQRGIRLTTTGRRLLRARRTLLVKFRLRQDSTDGRLGPVGFQTRLSLGGRKPEDPPSSDVGTCFER